MSELQLFVMVYGTIAGAIMGAVFGPMVIEWIEDKWFDLRERIQPTPPKPTGYCTNELIVPAQSPNLAG